MGHEDACITFNCVGNDAHLRVAPFSEPNASELISEIEEKSTQLLALARELSEISVSPEDDLIDGFSSWVAAEYARRRKREVFLPADVLLGEPGWDLLLDLAIQRCNHKQISITSACIAARVPSTTALRWISLLEQQGLVVRSMDEFDKRRTLVAITDYGFEQMLQYYRSLAPLKASNKLGAT